MTIRFLGPTSAKKRTPKPVEVPMSTFLATVQSGRRNHITDLKIAQGGAFKYSMNGVAAHTRPVHTSEFMLRTLMDNKIAFTAAEPAPPSPMVVLLQLFPFLWLGGLLYFMRRNVSDSVGKVGKRADLSVLDQSLTFDDVMGIESAKRDVQELVRMLKDPQPFARAGARLPSGLILVGPPGGGKTLLARCMAAEAGVPYFYCSGSEFNEMFVGRGAARVRKLFQTATKAAPSIIFFDELDTLGKQRSMSGMGGRASNDEAEQTLNQLLACMDGLDSNDNGVLVIAATNRYELLDSALTRPGRFDRIVRVDVPDEAGREAILRVHTRKMTLEDDSILEKVAVNTPGLTGAELAGIANEAAIRAVRRGDVVVTAQDFRQAVETFLTSRLRAPLPFLTPFLKPPRW